jgi:hypothetical protein
MTPSKGQSFMFALFLMAVLLSSSVPTASAMRTEYDRFIAKHSEKCIDVNNDSNDNGAVIQQYDCNGTGAQNWEAEPVDIKIINGQRVDYYQLRKAGTSKCLDVPGGSVDKGAGLILWDCHGGPNQQFSMFLYQNQEHQISLINRKSGMCLDVAGASKDNGARIIQYYCAQSNNQIFYWSW